MYEFFDLFLHDSETFVLTIVPIILVVVFGTAFGALAYLEFRKK